MLFQIGEKVVFLNEAGGGIVTAIQGSTIFVQDETGFDRPFKIKDLGKVHSTNYSKEIESQKTIDLKTSSKKEQLFIIKKDFWEIDLHLDNLVDFYGEKLLTSDDQALIKQLAVFKDVFHKAKAKKIRKIIVIHGFGKGVLRQALQDYLRGQEGVDFFDAPYIEYGHGAIQVEVKYRY
ncbi:MAG: Smr/MutS family protein [Crocinitomicaceae bacterium]|nr:Smr/MutS family protein [Crocinitomicaceae bacterium]